MGEAMTYTAGDQFKAPSRISRERFATILRQHAAPGVIAERDPGVYWDAIVGIGVDPLFIAAMFNHESQFGKDGVAATTHSFGNTRAPHFGATPIGETPGRTGTFPIWRDWLDGCKSTAARLASPDWYYAGERRNIGQVFNDPVVDNPYYPHARQPVPRKVVNGTVQRIEWAPAGDLNNPAGYLAAVLRDMNAWADQEAPMVDITGYVPPKIEQQWFPSNGKSYLGEPMDMHGVCVHTTGNASAGSEAQNNVVYMRSPECIAREASWHATVGHDVIIETIPDDRQAFHGSDNDGPGNTHYFAVEGVECYPVGSPKAERVLQNHAWYVAKKLRDKGLPLTFNQGKTGTVAQHHDFARDQKNCPRRYRDAPGAWDRFMAYVTAFYGAAAAPGGVDRLAMPPLNPAAIEGKIWPFVFHDFYAEHGGVAAFGLVTSGVFQEGGKLVAYTEAARLEYQPAVDGKVERGLLANELKPTRYPGGYPA